jgi:hypothetical protein
MADDDTVMAVILALGGFLLANPLIAGGIMAGTLAPGVATDTGRKAEAIGIPQPIADLMGWSSLAIPFPGPAGTQRFFDWIQGHMRTIT